MAIESINVEVAYAMPEKQIIRVVNVDIGTTIGAAIVQSGIMMDFPCGIPISRPGMPLTRARSAILQACLKRPSRKRE